MEPCLTLSRRRSTSLSLMIAVLLCGTVSAQNTKTIFEELVAKKENAGLVQLWTNNPFETLPTIDSYLENSLKLVETSDRLDREAIHGNHAKALTGARAADEAFGTVIFSEYASSFIGWSREQQQQFRSGQKAYGDAQAALQSERFDAALAAGEDCVTKAQPLGDWWGTAMGNSAIGAAQKGLGDQEKALTAFTSSRAIYHDLRLGGAELNCTFEMVVLLRDLHRMERAKITCQQGVALAERLGNGAAKAQLSQILASFE